MNSWAELALGEAMPSGKGKRAVGPGGGTTPPAAEGAAQARPHGRKSAKPVPAQTVGVEDAEVGAVLDAIFATGGGFQEALALLEGQAGLAPATALTALLGWLKDGRALPPTAASFRGALPGFMGCLPALAIPCSRHLLKGDLAPQALLDLLAAWGVHPVSFLLAGPTHTATRLDLQAALGLADDPIAQGICGPRTHHGGLDLSLYGQADLTELPAGLGLVGNLKVARTGLRRLPEDLRVVGRLEAHACPLLEGIPDSLAKTLRHLDLSRCVTLKTLPDGLSVKGNLNLAKSGLTTLPPDLMVWGTLDLRGCAAWDRRLPADAILEWPWRHSVSGRDVEGVIRTDDFPDKQGTDPRTYRAWMAAHGLGEAP
jgi:hypothetical protein